MTIRCGTEFIRELSDLLATDRIISLGRELIIETAHFTFAEPGHEEVWIGSKYQIEIVTRPMKYGSFFLLYKKIRQLCLTEYPKTVILKKSKTPIKGDVPRTIIFEVICLDEKCK